MNIYHTRSKIKSKRHQPTKNRETSALKLRKISWLITKKKHSKILHKSQTAYKRRSLLLHFPTALSSRSIWQREHSTQNIKVRASLHREPWKKKQQLSYNYYRRKCWEGCYFLPFSSPRPWPNTEQNVYVCARDCSVISQQWIGRQERYLAKERTLFFED